MSERYTKPCLAKRLGLGVIAEGELGGRGSSILTPPTAPSTDSYFEEKRYFIDMNLVKQVSALYLTQYLSWLLLLMLITHLCIGI